jgi:hypothetical protein
MSHESGGHVPPVFVFVVIIAEIGGEIWAVSEKSAKFVAIT